MIKTNNDGEKIKIIKYDDSKHILVQFIDYDEYIVKDTTWKHFKNGSLRNPEEYKRLGKINTTKDGEKIKIIKYNNTNDIIVQFIDHDEYIIKQTAWRYFLKGNIRNPIRNDKKERTGLLSYNYQGCLMKIIEYNSYNNIIVEFQDEYKTKVKSKYCYFENGQIKNPYYPSVYGVGITGNKCNVSSKEYRTWQKMLQRSCNENFKNNNPSYKDVTCCKEWLLYENFYEWLHSQENFDKWLNGERWAVDKDILIKGNKIYSPKTCCLVPQNVNSLFTKREKQRGELPIGVMLHKNKTQYVACCGNQFIKNLEYSYLGAFTTPEDAFYEYKKEKERIIKKTAEIEYEKMNITKCCYDAMMKYEVEITD